MLTKLFRIVPAIVLGGILFSCNQSSPSYKEEIIEIIRDNRPELFRTSSAKELESSLTETIEEIIEYLDSNDGYRYSVDDKDLEEVLVCFNEYNLSFVYALGSYYHDISEQAWVRNVAAPLLVTMREMERNVLTTPRKEFNYRWVISQMMDIGL